MLFLEHELPLIAINFCRGNVLSLTRIYTVNNVRKLSTSPVRRVTPSSGKSEVATEWEQPYFWRYNCQPKSGKDIAALQRYSVTVVVTGVPHPKKKVYTIYLYI